MTSVRPRLGDAQAGRGQLRHGIAVLSGDGRLLTRSCSVADRYGPTSFRMSRPSIHAVDCALNHLTASK